VVRGSRFYHADLGFTVAFPTGWTVDNQQKQVIAFTAAKDTALAVTAEPIPPNTTPQQYVARLAGGAILSKAQPLAVNGLDGYTAIVPGVKLPWGNQGPMRLAIVYYNNQAYVFRGASRIPTALPASDPVLLSSISTFRKLKDNEFSLAEPQRIGIVKAGPQTRIEDLARTSPIRKYPLERLRLLNDLYPDKEPTPGQSLKVVY
jgi:predicted Zn-dependent protease